MSAIKKNASLKRKLKFNFFNNCKKVKFSNTVANALKEENTGVQEKDFQETAYPSTHHENLNIRKTNLASSSSYNEDIVYEGNNINAVDVKEENIHSHIYDNSTFNFPKKFEEEEFDIDSKFNSQILKNDLYYPSRAPQKMSFIEQFDATESNLSLKIDKIYTTDEKSFESNSFEPILKTIKKGRNLRNKKMISAIKNKPVIKKHSIKNIVKKCHICFCVFHSESEWLLHLQSIKHQEAYISFRNNLGISEQQITGKDHFNHNKSIYTKKNSNKKEADLNFNKLNHSSSNAHPTSSKNKESISEELNYSDFLEVNYPSSHLEPVTYFPLNLLKKKAIIFGNIQEFENFPKYKLKEKGKYLHKNPRNGNPTESNNNNTDLPLIFLPYQVRVTLASGKPKLVSMYFPYFDKNVLDSTMKECWSQPSESWIGECVDHIKEKINISFNSNAKTQHSDMLVNRVIDPVDKENFPNFPKQIFNDNEENLNPESLPSCLIDKTNSEQIQPKNFNLTNVKSLNKIEIEDQSHECIPLRNIRKDADSCKTIDNNSDVDNKIFEKPYTDSVGQKRAPKNDCSSITSETRKDNPAPLTTRKYNTRKSSRENPIEDLSNNCITGSTKSREKIFRDSKLKNISKKKACNITKKISDDEFSFESFNPVPVQNVSPMYLLSSSDEEESNSEVNFDDFKEIESKENKNCGECTKVTNKNNNKNIPMIYPDDGAIPENNKNKVLKRKKRKKKNSRKKKKLNGASNVCNKKNSLENFKNKFKQESDLGILSNDLEVKEILKQEESIKVKDENWLSSQEPNKILNEIKKEEATDPFIEASVCTEDKKFGKDKDIPSLINNTIEESQVNKNVHKGESIVESTAIKEENITESNTFEDEIINESKVIKETPIYVGESDVENDVDCIVFGNECDGEISEYIKLLNDNISQELNVNDKFETETKNLSEAGKLQDDEKLPANTDMSLLNYPKCETKHDEKMFPCLNFSNLTDSEKKVVVVRKLDFSPCKNIITSNKKNFDHSNTNLLTLQDIKVEETFINDDHTPEKEFDNKFYMNHHFDHSYSLPYQQLLTISVQERIQMENLL